MDSRQVLGRMSEEAGAVGQFSFLYLGICQAQSYGCHTLNTAVSYVFLTWSIAISFFLVPIYDHVIPLLKLSGSQLLLENPQTFQHNRDPTIWPKIPCHSQLSPLSRL